MCSTFARLAASSRALGQIIRELAGSSLPLILQRSGIVCCCRDRYSCAFPALALAKHCVLEYEVRAVGQASAIQFSHLSEVIMPVELSEQSNIFVRVPVLIYGVQINIEVQVDEVLCDYPCEDEAQTPSDAP